MRLATSLEISCHVAYLLAKLTNGVMVVILRNLGIARPRWARGTCRATGGFCGVKTHEVRHLASSGSNPVREHAMSRVWLILIGVIVAAFALPALVTVIEGLIPALVAGVVLFGVGMLIFRRARRW